MLRVVADEIDDSAPRWFVMRLRPRRTPDDIRLRIEREFGSSLGHISWYYPVRRLMRPVGKKVIPVDVPVIPQLLFFRMRRSEVGRLFARIGDDAWCYRVSGRPGSPYSVIPASQMARLQKCVGQLTPDVEMEIVKVSPTPQVGDAVRVTAGLLEGKEGVVTSVRNADGTRTYTLRLSDSEAIRWNASDIHEAYLEKI